LWANLDFHNHFTVRTEKKVVILTWKCDSVYIRNNSLFGGLLDGAVSTFWKNMFWHFLIGVGDIKQNASLYVHQSTDNKWACIKLHLYLVVTASFHVRKEIFVFYDTVKVTLEPSHVGVCYFLANAVKQVKIFLSGKSSHSCMFVKVVLSSLRRRDSSLYIHTILWNKVSKFVTDDLLEGSQYANTLQYTDLFMCCNCQENILPSIMIEWLSHLLRIWNVLGSILSPETGYPDWYFVWFSSVPPGERWDCTFKLCHDLLLSNLSPFHLMH
jgi:hypothetical protein